MNVDLLAIAGTIADARRARTARNAAAEVRRAIAEFCSAQINGGVGILICDNPVR